MPESGVGRKAFRNKLTGLSIQVAGETHDCLYLHPCTNKRSGQIAMIRKRLLRRRCGGKGLESVFLPRTIYPPPRKRGRKKNIRRTAAGASADALRFQKRPSEAHRTCWIVVLSLRTKVTMVFDFREDCFSTYYIYDIYLMRPWWVRGRNV